MGTTEDSRTETLRTRVTLCVVLALVLPLGLAGAGLLLNVVGSVGSLMGGRSPESHGTVLLIAAAVLGVGLPVVGIATAAETGQRAARVVLGVVLAITLALLALSAGRATTDKYEAPTEAPSHDGPPPCMEHSGGEATCPGG